LEKKNIELEIILRDPALAIEADINLIDQVMINLLVNAIEAVKDKRGTAHHPICRGKSNNKTLVKVMDNGLGMPPELLDKIFIPSLVPAKPAAVLG
jgi:two-component system nitrogen regulation sensor histidine kinase NtrY